MGMRLEEAHSRQLLGEVKAQLKRTCRSQPGSGGGGEHLPRNRQPAVGEAYSLRAMGDLNAGPTGSRTRRCQTWKQAFMIFQEVGNKLEEANTQVCQGQTEKQARKDWAGRNRISKSAAFQPTTRSTRSTWKARTFAALG